MRKTLLATAMIVPFVLLAIWPLATAHADNEKLPMTYVAAMSGIQGNLVARAANCGFAGDRAADLRRIIIAAAVSSGFDPEAGLADPDTISRVRSTIENALFAQTPCALVKVYYNWFELVPSTSVGPWMTSNVQGMGTVEQFGVELQRRTEALVGAIQPSGRPGRNPSPTH
jgi:hypothetical protein